MRLAVVWGLASVLLWTLPAAARDPGVLQLSPGHGGPTAFVVAGRLIEDKGLSKARRTASRLRNLRRAIKQLNSEEIEDAVVELRLGAYRLRQPTDEEGRFEFRAVRLDPPLTPGLHQAEVVVIESRGHPTPNASVSVQILAEEPGVAIISDVDDTIVVTNVVSKRAMIKNALLKNAAQVLAVPGVGPAFRAAQAAGAQATFYVSGSPQNFLPRILHFIERESLPAGPVLLKDFGSDPLFAQGAYKAGRIRQILAMHPGLRFILVGDSGETDPEIYARLRGQFPDRIVAIVIRRVPHKADSSERFDGMVTIRDYLEDPMTLAKLVGAALGPVKHGSE